jgi:hypothetical protein
MVEMEDPGRDLAAFVGIRRPGIGGLGRQLRRVPAEQQAVVEPAGEEGQLGAIQQAPAQHAGRQIEQAAVAAPPGAFHRAAEVARHLRQAGGRADGGAGCSRHRPWDRR